MNILETNADICDRKQCFYSLMECYDTLKKIEE